MNNISGGSLPLFRFAGIQVSLHWSWLVVGYLEVMLWSNRYGSLTWNILEYLALFGIVLLHEFGHALACRQVGGQANRIMLWPLGGVAFVQPPPRPGATLWSIAAGPLVNVALIPVTVGVLVAASALNWQRFSPDLMTFLMSLASINFGLLVFNMLPIYPLDGGQILRSLLWFVLGPARSLMVAGLLGVAGAAGLFILAMIYTQDIRLALLTAFVAWQAWRGFRLGTKLHSMKASIDVMEIGAKAFREGRLEEAIARFSELIDAGGDNPTVLATAHVNRGHAESRRGGWERAIQDYHETLRLQPTLISAHNNLAWLLAACPVDALRDGQEAVKHATLACNATGWSNANIVSTFAAASAEAGDFVQAVKWQKYAIGDRAYRKAHGEQQQTDRLQQYEQGIPFRLPVSGK